MEIDILSDKLKQQLSSWFHRRDRSVYLAPDTFYFLNNGAYLATAFISETVLSAVAASVTFSNIPQGFRHLTLQLWVRTASAAEADNIIMRFNGDVGTNYDTIQTQGNGVTMTVTSARATASPLVGGSEAANSRAFNFSPIAIQIPHYSLGGIEKKWIALSSIFGDRSADTDLFNLSRVGAWRNTNVITSIVFTANSGANFVTGSRFQLYGIL